MTDERRVRVAAYQAVIVVAALGVLAVAWWQVGQPPSRDVAFVAGALMVLAAIGERTELAFRFGGEGFAATSAGVPLLVSALFLPAWLAGAVAFASYVVVELRPGQAMSALFGAGASTLALVSASSIARGIAGGAPDPQLALVAGMVAAIVFELAYTGMGMLMLELRRPGSAAAFLPDARPVIVFDVVLGIIGIMVVAPFGDQASMLLAVLVAFQLVAHAGLAMLNREQVQRGRATLLQRTFSRYVPEPVVRRLIESGEDVELGGESRTVTVLFCDIRGFTSWAEQRTPAEVLADLNDLLGELAQCVFGTEGTLDKYTGDGLMAFWGAPVAHADHAERAVATARRMLEAVARHNEGRVVVDEEPVAIGVGIHTGPAIVGNVGHEERHDYTAIGDTVNVAARLEASGKDVGAPIVLSRATRDLLGEDARSDDLKPAGLISVKGRDARLDVFTITPGGP